MRMTEEGAPLEGLRGWALGPVHLKPPLSFENVRQATESCFCLRGA